MYAFNHDRDAGILRLKLTGFWSADVMERFAGELTTLVRRVAREDPGFVILSNCLDYPVQSTEIGEGWARLLGADTQIRVPYAVVVGSILNKLQAERALTAPNVRVFSTIEAASAWLEEVRSARTDPARSD